MMSENPFFKNQDIELRIDGMTSDGNGVGHLNGVAFFVPDTNVGELVAAHIVKVEKRYCIAKLVHVIQKSESRVIPRCSAYALCGGCTMQHMDYAEQLKQKRLFVKDALERIGGLSGIEVPPVIGMDDPWRYRNKGSFPFGAGAAGAVFGFYANRSHRLIPISDCPIQSATIMKTVSAVAKWANECKISIYDEKNHAGSLRACMVRETSDGEIMSVVITKGKLAYREALMKELSFVDSLFHNRNDRDTNVLLGNEFTLLSGKDVLIENYSGFLYSVSPESFLQVNYKQTEKLYKTAIDLLKPEMNETILDLYCGAGTMSLQIAKHANRVIGIECVPKAIENAKRNAAMNGIKNVHFICGNAEDILPELLQNGTTPDAIMLDPPRKGCEPTVLESIAQTEVKRIVYVSCNPSTLGRDLNYLVKEKFVIHTIQPIDMFPQTGHVETVCLLTHS